MNVKRKIKVIIIKFYVSVLLEQRKSIGCSKNAFSFFDLKLDTLLQVIWHKLHSVTGVSIKFEVGGQFEKSR